MALRIAFLAPSHYNIPGVRSPSVDTMPTSRILGTMDQDFRRSLIEALKSRSWTHLDAERTADGIAVLYQTGAEPWRVRLATNADEPDRHLVARNASEASVFDSALGGRARDVAAALNELEGHDSDATGTH